MSLSTTNTSQVNIGITVCFIQLKSLFIHYVLITKYFTKLTLTAEIHFLLKNNLKNDFNLILLHYFQIIKFKNGVKIILIC